MTNFKVMKLTIFFIVKSWSENQTKNVTQFYNEKIQ